LALYFQLGRGGEKGTNNLSEVDLTKKSSLNDFAKKRKGKTPIFSSRSKGSLKRITNSGITKGKERSPLPGQNSREKRKFLRRLSSPGGKKEKKGSRPNGSGETVGKRKDGETILCSVGKQKGGRCLAVRMRLKRPLRLNGEGEGKDFYRGKRGANLRKEATTFMPAEKKKKKGRAIPPSLRR